MRICIAGGPRTGKTTLSAQLGRKLGIPVYHTDDLLSSSPTGALKRRDDWSGQSEEVARWFSRPGSWIIEGVTVPRALRKWLAAHPGQAPCDKVIWLTRPKVSRNKGQEAMANGCLTVWREIQFILHERGVEMEMLP